MNPSVAEAPLQTLESYLTEGIHRDRADVEAIESVLHTTAATIRDTFLGRYWPYEARREGELLDQGLSQSTSAMMIRAIDLLLGSAHANAPLPRYPFELDSKLAKKLEEVRGFAEAELSTAIAGTNPRPAAKGRRSAGAPSQAHFGTRSKTYGRDDPLTLSFLAEIFPPAGPGTQPAMLKFITERADEFLKMDPEQDARGFFSFDPGAREVGQQPLSNAFIPLRIVRAGRTMKVAGSKAYSTYLRYFEGTLHDQLSFISIPDSRFDPAELAFCLEGMLLTSDEPVDKALFDRILDVLEGAQSSSAHWRPTKPFLRDERGMVLFPVSVEAANSLLRSCQILDKWPQFEQSTQKYIELLRRFWDWLRTRRTSFASKKGGVPVAVAGWHSEHINDPDSIQLWDTAQVVEFVLGYRRRLQLHIAKTTLRLSRFDVRPARGAKLPWSEQTRPRQGLERKSGDDPDDRPRPSGYRPATTIVDQFEPVTTLGTRLEAYRKIEKDFIDGWLKGEPDNYSMLLYGPPGTGKTTVAENIADALGFPLVTVTVSDFLAEGGVDVEARAKMIFDVLEAQSDCVVLFDEIDELVLDRSSERHRSQDTVFKFMTPGMLTKLNNLRRKKRLIFMMATNYAYRIDPAIRRTGRVDENYLLLPPDQAARMRMLGDLLEEFAKKGRLATGTPLHPDTISQKELTTLSQHAFFLGFKDIETAIGRVLRSDQPTVARLQTELANWGRTTTLRFYQAGFDEGADVDALEAEFLPLVLLGQKEGAAVSDKHGSLSLKMFIDEMQNAAEARRKEPRYFDQTQITEAADAWLLRQDGGGDQA